MFPHMGASLNDGTPETPQNDHFLVGKPIVVGYCTTTLGNPHMEL